MATRRNKLHHWLQSINPLNYLASKIFLYFWFMIAFTVISLVLIGYQVEPNYADKPIPPHILAQVDSIEEQLMRSRRQTSFNYERLLRSRRFNHHHTLIYSQMGQPLKSSKPLPQDFDLSRLDTKTQQTTILASNEYVVYGPFQLKNLEQQYQLFLLNPRKSHPMMSFRNLPWWLRLGIPLTISAILSLFIARTLVTPIKNLCTAHRSLAQGHLDTRSNGVALRKDELGQLGHDFDNMAEKISQLLAAQKRLLGDVSHELRSPLARLQIALGLVSSTPNVAENKDLVRHLERIELEAHRLDDMIGDVLRLSRLESQLQNIECFSLSLKSLLEFLVKDANFEAQGENKQVTLSLTEDAQILGDQGLLASAFENVIRNAVKYTQADSTVEVSMSVETNLITTRIRDHGPGVPTSALSQLFEPFYRVSDSRQRASGGTGLGLAIAEKSISAHGGSISAHNHEDQGLEVVIRLPIKDNTHQ